MKNFSVRSKGYLLFVVMLMFVLLGSGISIWRSRYDAENIGVDYRRVDLAISQIAAMTDSVNAYRILIISSALSKDYFVQNEMGFNRYPDKVMELSDSLPSLMDVSDVAVGENIRRFRESWGKYTDIINSNILPTFRAGHPNLILNQESNQIYSDMAAALDFLTQYVANYSKETVNRRIQESELYLYLSVANIVLAFILGLILLFWLLKTRAASGNQLLDIFDSVLNKGFFYDLPYLSAENENYQVIEKMQIIQSKLGDSIRDIERSAEFLISKSKQLTDNSRELLELAKIEQEALELSSKAMELLSSQKQSIMDQFDNGKDNIESTYSRLESVSAEAGTLVDKITDLRPKSKFDTTLFSLKMNDSMIDISNCADKSNILVMDSVTATAMAGEYGYAFNEVVDQIRSLAEQLTNNAGNVKSLLAEFNKGLEENKESSSIEEITSVVNAARDIANTVIRSMDSSKILKELLSELKDHVEKQNKLTEQVAINLVNLKVALSEKDLLIHKSMDSLTMVESGVKTLDLKVKELLIPENGDTINSS